MSHWRSSAHRQRLGSGCSTRLRAPAPIIRFCGRKDKHDESQNQRTSRLRQRPGLQAHVLGKNWKTTREKGDHLNVRITSQNHRRDSTLRVSLGRVGTPGKWRVGRHEKTNATRSEESNSSCSSRNLDAAKRGGAERTFQTLSACPVPCPRCGGKLTPVAPPMLNCDGCHRWWRHCRPDKVCGLVGTIKTVGPEVFTPCGRAKGELFQ